MKIGKVSGITKINKCSFAKKFLRSICVTMESKGQKAREAYAKKCSEFWDKMEQECIRQAKAGNIRCSLKKHQQSNYFQSKSQLYNRGFYPMIDGRDWSDYEFEFPQTGVFKTIQESRARRAYQKSSQKLLDGMTKSDRLTYENEVFDYYSWSTLEKMAGWAKKDGFNTRFDEDGVYLTIDSSSTHSISKVRSFWNKARRNCILRSKDNRTCRLEHEEYSSPFFTYKSILEEQGFQAFNTRSLWFNILHDEKTSK